MRHLQQNHKRWGRLPLWIGAARWTRRWGTIMSVMLVAALVVNFSLPGNAHAETPTAGLTVREATLYALPDYAAPMTTVPPQTALYVQGRTDTAHWVLVEIDSLAGWLPTSAVAMDALLYELPITAQQRVSLNWTDFPLAADDEALVAQVMRLAQTPILHNFESPRLHTIFAWGQSLGRRPDVFIKVGDSNTTSGDFLRPFGKATGGCQYGEFAYLSETVAHFDAVPTHRRPWVNSFDSVNLTALNGLSTSSLLDPLWAPGGGLCTAEETLIPCEVRIVNPSVAIILIGLMDLEYIEVGQYAINLHEAVGLTVDAGVIPVLTTFPVLPDYPHERDSWWGKSIALNNAILDVAEDYAVPVINLWAASQHLPDYGIGPDRTHFKHVVGEFCNFTGAEQTIGGTLRNLLTLQALDLLRREVLLVDAN